MALTHKMGNGRDYGRMMIIYDDNEIIVVFVGSSWIIIITVL